MSKLKSAIILVLILVSGTNYAQYTDVINSNRPGKSMSAFAIGKNVIQVETGVYKISEYHNLLGYDADGYGIDLSLRYGFWKEQLELIAEIQYQNQEFINSFSSYTKSDFRQTVFGAKYLIYDPFKNHEKKVNVHSWKANHAFDWHQFVPAVSIYAGANFTMKDNPYSFSAESMISPKIMLITQNHFDGAWVFVTNIFADYIGTDYPSYGFVATMTKGIDVKWSAFVENQTFFSDFYSDSLLRGGLAFLIYKDMQIDASASTNFKDTPNIFYGGVGFSWRYDASYKEVRMKKSDGKTKENDAKKTKALKKIEKQIEKRRKDAIE